MSISNCCSAYVDEDILICEDCKEHCEAVEEDTAYQDALDDLQREHFNVNK
jgi:hypothetical protein